MNDANARELRVREAEPRDAGRGIVRLPEGARRDLGVLSGDAVTLEGEHATVAKVWPAGSDLADDEIRVDGETRRNADVRVGDVVSVSPASVEEGEQVTVEPTTPLGSDPDTVTDVVRQSLRDRPVTNGERVKVDALGEAGELRVVATDPAETVLVTGDTTIEVEQDEQRGWGDGDERGEQGGKRPAAGSQGSEVGLTYEDIGGLGEELDQVRELVELPLAEPGTFQRLGIEPPKGVLMHGPPGTGKTLIARAVANEADAHFVHVSGPEIMRKYKGESEERLREVFDEAAEHAPSIIFFDEIDAIAGKRDDGGDMENRVVAQLLSLLDGLEARGEVVVIAATNRVDTIDPALRRPGRFDREVEVGVPDRDGREEILQIHTRGMPLADDVALGALAERTHGFVGADLRALATEAAMSALRRDQRGETAEAETDADAVAVTREDFEGALAAAEPSAMREFVAELPETSFDDVGGLDQAKTTLREAVEWPLAYPALYDETATDPPTGVLLYGPPGTGKTMLARAVANESGVNFIRVAGPELLDKYVGESERAVREVFERARQAAPTVVFFDEIDAIAGARGEGRHEVTERVVSQLLTELDGIADNPRVIVLAATNRRDALDPALLRPGRLESHVEVPAPGEDARREILAVQTTDKPLGDDVTLADLAGALDGYTGAEIESVVREASLSAIRRAAEERGVDAANEHAAEIRLSAADFEAAIESVDAAGRE